MIKPEHIAIPWYRHKVNKIKIFDMNGGEENPFDPNKRRKPNKKKPDKPKPKPTPSLRPEPNPDWISQLKPATSRGYLVELNYTSETGEWTETPIPTYVPSKNPLPPKTRTPANRGYERTPLPSPSYGFAKPSVHMPSGEILFKLMEAAPNGQYDKALKQYNDFTLELYWNTANPFIVFERPTYKEVKLFIDTHDMSKVTSADVTKYFKDKGVKGKDLSSLPTRLFIYYESLELMTAIEDIIVPPIRGNQIEM